MLTIEWQYSNKVVTIMNTKKSFKNVLEFVHKFRRKNKIQREISDIKKKIRDNQTRILLLENLNQYITKDMNYEEIKETIFIMKNDYEDRVDDYIVKSAGLYTEKKNYLMN